MTTLADLIHDSTRNDGVMIPIEAITIPWFLPVREEELKSKKYFGLRDSIKKDGQKVAIRVRLALNGYELEDGFLRLNAMREQGMKEIRAIVAPATDEELMVESIIINKERIKDNSIILAQKCNYFLKHGHHTQEWVAEKVGLSRTSVAHHVRLLDLYEDIQKCVARHNLTYHHALLLLRIKDPKLQVQVAEEAMTQHLSTRQLEGRIATIIDSTYAPPKRGTVSPQELVEAERRMREALVKCHKCKKLIRYDQLAPIGENHQLYCPGCAPGVSTDYKNEKALVKRLEETKQASSPHIEEIQENSESEENEKVLDLTRELQAEGLPIETDFVQSVLELHPNGHFKDVNMIYFVDEPSKPKADIDRDRNLRELCRKYHPEVTILSVKRKDNTPKDDERIKSEIRKEHKKLEESRACDIGAR